MIAFNPFLLHRRNHFNPQLLELPHEIYFKWICLLQ